MLGEAIELVLKYVIMIVACIGVGFGISIGIYAALMLMR